MNDIPEYFKCAKCKAFSDLKGMGKVKLKQSFIDKLKDAEPKYDYFCKKCLEKVK